ncbi:hypothetical protein B9Z65_8942 [Elsinoe australis]|uniref:Gfd2/YDR514C-like C-terminal domain-containing protein n=1 Tax=Elsinoe australis TaxID=40998 RepID=A0A2P7ZYW8_9PEZI|nr:hypothetical protein B9Z65_8942 [Elsinoe australis]
MPKLLGLPDPSTTPPNFNPATITSTTPIKDVVFMSIDFEASERAQKSGLKVTEVGLAILDTRALVYQPPGTDATSWLSKIVAKHYIVRENQHLVIGTYVSGSPGAFHFGTSEVRGQASTGQHLAYDLRHPPSPTAMSEGERRSIVLVGHALHNDMKYFEALGVRPYQDAWVRDTIDTQDLCCYESRLASLGDLLGRLGVEGRDTHNAGNDAVYSLQALVKMVYLWTYEGERLGEMLKPLLYPAWEEGFEI